MKFLITFCALALTWSTSSFAWGGLDDSVWVPRIYPQTVPGYSSICGSIANGVCAAMHGSGTLGAADMLAFRTPTHAVQVILNSTNPDISKAKYLKIEKEYAARGEPLNVESLVRFMGHLAKNPSSKCDFDMLSSGGYGLKCNGPGKVQDREFPGLTETLLEKEFAKYDATPTEEKESMVADEDDLQRPNPEGEGLPTDDIPVVQENPDMIVPSSLETGNHDRKPTAAVR